MSWVRKPKGGVDFFWDTNNAPCHAPFLRFLRLESPSTYNIANDVNPFVQPVMNLETDSNICWLCRVPNGGRCAAKLAARHAAIFARFWQCDGVRPRYG